MHLPNPNIKESKNDDARMMQSVEAIIGKLRETLAAEVFPPFSWKRIAHFTYCCCARSFKAWPLIYHPDFIDAVIAQFAALEEYEMCTAIQSDCEQARHMLGEEMLKETQQRFYRDLTADGYEIALNVLR